MCSGVGALDGAIRGAIEGAAEGSDPLIAQAPSLGGLVRHPGEKSARLHGRGILRRSATTRPPR